MNTATAGAVFEIRPESSGVVFTPGDKVRVVNYANAGSVVITPAPGVVLFKKVGGNPTLANTGNFALCEYVGADNWVIMGDYT